MDNQDLPSEKYGPLKIESAKDRHFSNIVQVLWYGIDGYQGLPASARHGFCEVYLNTNYRNNKLFEERSMNMVVAFAKDALTDDNERIFPEDKPNATAILTADQFKDYEARIRALMKRVLHINALSTEAEKRWADKDRNALRNKYGENATKEDRIAYVVEVVCGELELMVKKHQDVSFLAVGNQQNIAYWDLHKANQKPKAWVDKENGKEKDGRKK